DVIKLQTNMPSVVKLDASELPRTIMLEIPSNFPSVLKLDASDIPSSIQVTGIPQSIELKGFVPSEIMIKAPENLEVPLVYKGGPIPFEFSSKKFTDGNDDLPCFAFLPCPQK